ncbi:MAG: hypothetical protein U9N80_14880 [Chloroflexota bacterium]|nr:hypothetical protein [Chloroflexota bacterium]
MYGDIKHGNQGMWISLCCGFLILGLAACNLPGTGADDPEPTLTGGASQEGGLGKQEATAKKGDCPPYETMAYELLYRHEVILQSGDIGKGSHFFEWKEEEPAIFDLLFEPSGKVSNEDLPNTVTIDVLGWVETGSKDCPVQYLQGVWTLSADIQGKCENGVVTLTVVEHYEDHELAGSCDDPISVPVRTSAPEVKLTFKLSEPGSTDGLIGGSKGDRLYTFYWYELIHPDTLELVPLPSQ